jgi:hypothetical protein
MASVFNGSRAGTPRIINGFGSLIAVSILLVGCTGYESLSKQSVDESFTVLGLSWAGGNSTLIVLKAFESDNRLAVCGSRTASGGSDVHAQLEQQFFDRASVVIGEEDIGPLSFVSRVPKSGLEVREEMDRYVAAQWSGNANCVRTKLPWKENYLEKAISYKGPSRVRGRF